MTNFSNINIRKCKQTDLTTLKELTRRWFSGDLYIEDNWQDMRVLEIDFLIKGYADCKNNRIEGLLIDFNNHRTGLGTLLLKHCENHIWQAYTYVELETFEHSIQANQFYIKNGYLEIKRFYDNTLECTKILYRKSKPDKY